MPEKKKRPQVQQTAIGDGIVQVAGGKNTVNVNQTIIQRIFNIFRSDAETLEQRNRRIMLGHVENFWVKGILEKSLHGAALLELGIKEDPDALSYPWALKREANKETLPAGTSMLAIFQEIGMGRSLLILGAPGSGKTTMLLELTRQLIERAREDVTEPIPVVFNLSSWTEKLTFADWLAKELNVIYTIPKNIAPTWVKENKILLLLDGLDEVRQESRDQCVDAINQFRKENGLTSMVVCSRIQDYAELKTRFSFDGAIEIRPLTSDQVDKYFKRPGKGLAGIRQVLEKDTVLREMAETPLFLSIMMLAYRDIQSKDILVTKNIEAQRKHLFDTYIERIFERPRSNNSQFKKQDVLHWLSWLAQKMIEHSQVPYLLENMQPKWLSRGQSIYRVSTALCGCLIGALVFYPVFGTIAIGTYEPILRLIVRRIIPVLGALIVGVITGLGEIKMVDALTWDWKLGKTGLIFGLILGLIAGIIFGMVAGWGDGPVAGLNVGLISVLYLGVILGLIEGLVFGMSAKPVSQTTYPGQRIAFSVKNFFSTFLLLGLIIWLTYGIFMSLLDWLLGGLLFVMINLSRVVIVLGLSAGLLGGLRNGGFAAVQHYTLRFVIALKNLLPYRLTSFLDYCVDLIFLRRVGGGYIFVHRLLMEHFAAMYPESEK